MATTPEILEKACEVLARGWEERYMARNVKHVPVEPTAPDAVAWCLIGSVFRACWELTGSMDDNPKASMFVWKYVHEKYNGRYTISDVNEKLCGSQLEVIKFMRQMVVAAKEQT